MNYKGYTAHIEVDDDDGVLYGWVEGIEDVVTFEADNLADLEREFRISVDDYFALCARDGVAPEKPAIEQNRAMMYKGYTARYEFDEDEGVLHGRVDGIRDIVSFVAETVEDLEREFQISVDVYLEFCAERGCEPNRPRADLRRASS